MILALAGLSGPEAPPGLPRDLAQLTRPMPVATDLTPPDLPRASSTMQGVAVPVSEVAGASSDATTLSFPPVEPVRAAVSVTVPDPTTEAEILALARGLEGVVHVSAITVAQTTLGEVPLRLAAVDPQGYRVFTPGETASHQPLWQRLAAGDVAVTHEFGTTHQVTLGTTLGAGAVQVPLRVGAFASNGTPPVADAIVSEEQGAALGLQGSRLVLIALDRAASPEATVEALTDAGFTAEEIPDPRAPRTDVVIPQGGITPENVWDHLALCESSGDWHINTGNGYYGGVQFLPESWWMVGGTGLPHEHTREEQIYRATLLWQIQGWEAWPQCARRLGLIID